MSSSSLRTINAACHCKSATFSITLPKDAFPLPAHFCHCNSCRRVTGQFCTTAATVPASWQPSPALLAKLQSFAFNDKVTVWFCPTCGTSIFAACKTTAACLADQGSEYNYIVCLGVLDEGDASVYEIKANIFVGDTLDGGLTDFLRDVGGKEIKTYEKYVTGPEWPLFSKSSDRAPIRQPAEGERLYAHCKCGGVEFWVAQPSRRSVWPEEAFKGMPIPEGFPEESRLTLKANWTKFPAAVCPCDSCRLAANGMAFAAWAYIPSVDVSLDAEGKVGIPRNLKWGTLKAYSFTERTSQHFCGTCGAMVFWDTKARPWLKDFGLGLFDSPDGARCESWFYWRTGQMNHREDGLRRAESLTLSIERGLQEYEQHVQGKLPGGERRI